MKNFLGLFLAFLVAGYLLILLSLSSGHWIIILFAAIASLAVNAGIHLSDQVENLEKRVEELEKECGQKTADVQVLETSEEETEMRQTK